MALRSITALNILVVGWTGVCAKDNLTRQCHDGLVHRQALCTRVHGEYYTKHQGGDNDCNSHGCLPRIASGY